MNLRPPTHTNTQTKHRGIHRKLYTEMYLETQAVIFFLFQIEASLQQYPPLSHPHIRPWRQL